MEPSSSPSALRVVDVIPTLQTLRPQDVGGRTAVVIDVLRATSTIVTALAAGAKEVRPAATPDEAQARFARLERAAGSREKLILGGERLGLKVEGFDLGNSPLEYTPEVVGERTIFFSTTNGTRTLRRAAGRRTANGLGPAREVIVAAFLNAGAVAEKIRAGVGGVVMACAGTRGGFSLEDILLAGLLVDSLERTATGDAGGRSPLTEPVFVFRDLARAAASLYREMTGPDGENLARAVVGTDHARYLASIGFAADVAYCASRDQVDIVPLFTRGRVRVQA